MSTYILVIDYILGLIMWTLIGRSAMNLFQREDSEFFFMKIFVKLTNPIINLFKFITPSFLIPIFIPLYVAWFFYLFRFYAMPYLLGYSVMGMLSFPLESEISREIYRIFGKINSNSNYNSILVFSYNQWKKYKFHLQYCQLILVN